MATQTLKELHIFVVEAIGRLNCIDATDPEFGEQVDEELNNIEGQIAAMLDAELPTSTEERERTSAASKAQRPTGNRGRYGTRQKD